MSWDTISCRLVVFVFTYPSRSQIRSCDNMLTLFGRWHLIKDFVAHFLASIHSIHYNKKKTCPLPAPAPSSNLIIFTKFPLAAWWIGVMPSLSYSLQAEGFALISRSATSARPSRHAWDQIKKLWNVMIFHLLKVQIHSQFWTEIKNSHGTLTKHGSWSIYNYQK